MLALALTGALSLGLIACGGDGEGTGQGSSADQAFLEGMVPHHHAAVAMARVAQDRAEHPQITRLAEEIVAVQKTEMAQMERIHQRLFDEDLQADTGAHEKLGLSAEEAGMSHGADSAAMLKDAEPFDQAFLDEMVPHHRGAVRMARAVLAETDDEDVRSLANDILSAQTPEISQMTRWRKAWDGDESMPDSMPEDTEEMEHGER